MAYESVDPVLRALADPRRRAMMDALREGERSVTEITALFDVSQPAISQHLAVLREAGLVEVRREGRRALYAPSGAGLARLALWIAEYERFWDERLDALARHLNRRN